MNPKKSPSLPPTSSPAWGSPALRPNSSFPPTNNLNNKFSNTPPHGPPFMPLASFGSATGAGSPHMGFHSAFRTPQPQQRQQSSSTQKGPWSDNKGYRRKHYQGNRGSHPNSPRDSPSVNPGGSDNIFLYYSPAMMQDPWLDTPPRPVDFWKR